MARYVDGFVLTVPRKNLAAYKKLAAKAGKVWMEYGALQYVECVGKDMRAKGVLPFPKLTKKKPNEVVVFSWIVYNSKAEQKEIIKKVMADKRFADMDPSNMPFDMKKMAYGGFEPLVDLPAPKKAKKKVAAQKKSAAKKKPAVKKRKTTRKG